MIIVSALASFLHRLFGSPAAPAPPTAPSAHSHRGRYVQTQYAQPQYAQPAPQPLAVPPTLADAVASYQANQIGVPIDPTAPTPSPYATTVPLDGMGMIHMAPGAMGEFVGPAGSTIDMIVDGAGAHFTAFASSDDTVMSNLSLNNDIGLNTANGFMLKTGEITLNVSWVDQYGNEQSSTIQVIAQ